MVKRHSGYFYIISIICIIAELFAYAISDIRILIICTSIHVGLFYVYLVRNKAKIISNIVYLIPALGVIYCFFFPFLQLEGIINSNLRMITSEAVHNGTCYCCIFISLYVVVIVTKPVLHDSYDMTWLTNLRMNNKKIFVDLVFLAITVFYYYSISHIGGVSFLLRNTLSRRKLLDMLYDIPFYSYIQYSFISYTIFSVITFFNTKTSVRNIIIKLISIGNLIVFWGLNILAGNRREFTYVALGCFLYLLSRNKGKVKKIIIFPMVLLVIFGIYIGLERSYENTFSLSQEDRIITAFGEFVYPIQTLYFYIANHVRPYQFGSTYLLVLFNLIPRNIWPNKPLSLGNQFKVDYHTTMGYAFSPMTELYINFSVFGFAIGAVILAILFYSLSKNKAKYPLLYLSMYIETLNFFRGEVSSVIMEVFLLWISLKLMIRFCSFEERKEKCRTR